MTIVMLRKTNHESRITKNEESVPKVGERFNLRVCLKVCLLQVKVNPNKYLRAAVLRERRVPYQDDTVIALLGGGVT